MATFCTNCGAPLEDAVKFCTNCGAQNAPQPQQAWPPQPPASNPAAQSPQPQPRKGKYLAHGIFMLLGLLIAVTSIILSVIWSKDMEKFMETAETATATVTSIRQNGDNHEVKVSFTAKDGLEREVRLNSAYTPSLRVGDAVTLYYDPLNPREVKAQLNYDPTIYLAIFPALGLAFIVIGICGAMKERRNMQLRADGERYEAVILGCSATAHVSRSSHITSTTYVLTCEYRDGDGVMRKCRSRMLSIDPRPQLPRGTVTVCVARGKHRSYYVAVDDSIAEQAQPSFV